MRGLTLILTDAGRLEPALALLMATAALGGRARLFALGPAVMALADPRLAEALDMGVEAHACQTGLADTGLDMSRLDARIAAAGPVAILQTLEDDRLATL